MVVPINTFISIIILYAMVSINTFWSYLVRLCDSLFLSRNGRLALFAILLEQKDRLSLVHSQETNWLENTVYLPNFVRNQANQMQAARACIRCQDWRSAFSGACILHFLHQHQEHLWGYIRQRWCAHQFADILVCRQKLAGVRKGLFYSCVAWLRLQLQHRVFKLCYWGTVLDESA